MNKTLVIYHNVALPNIPCRDGLVTAWVINKAVIDADFIGWHYSQNDRKEYPDVTGYKTVVIGDFHFPQSVLKSWHEVGIRIHVIDHHKTTLDDISSFKDVLGKRFQFDKLECGATLAWKYFFPYSPMPTFLKYIKDRDNFDKVLPQTEIVHCGLSGLWKGSLEGAFSYCDFLASLSEEKFLEYVLPIGEPLYLKRKEKVEGIIRRQGYKLIEVEGYTVPMIELKKSHEMYRSDIGEFLYKKMPEYPFIVIKKSTGGYSLRSDKHGSNFDITSIPGVEGHDNAGSTCELKYNVVN